MFIVNYLLIATHRRIRNACALHILDFGTIIRYRNLGIITRHILCRHQTHIDIVLSEKVRGNRQSERHVLRARAMILPVCPVLRIVRHRICPLVPDRCILYYIPGVGIVLQGFPILAVRRIFQPPVARRAHIHSHGIERCNLYGQRCIGNAQVRSRELYLPIILFQFRVRMVPPSTSRRPSTQGLSTEGQCLMQNRKEVRASSSPDLAKSPLVQGSNM